MSYEAEIETVKPELLPASRSKPLKIKQLTQHYNVAMNTSTQHDQTEPHCVHGDAGHAPLAAEVKADTHEHHSHDAHDHSAHGHDHASHHHDYRAHDKSLLMISFVITITMMVVEIVGGLLTHSLALVSDGIHMFTHAFALGLSWGAIVLAARPANMEKTFGYYRIEVVAAFVNGITILLSAVWIVIEGVTRLITPEPVNIVTTLVIATVASVGP